MIEIWPSGTEEWDVEYVYSSPYYALHKADLISLRVDKHFVKPVTIDQWVVIVYEAEKFYTKQNVAQTVKDFVHGCNAVGAGEAFIPPYVCRSPMLNDLLRCHRS